MANALYFFLELIVGITYLVSLSELEDQLGYRIDWDRYEIRE